MTDLEFDLRGRFTVETRSFRETGTELEMILPAAPEELIDVSAFNIDERLPYWAELWPSARALARFLVSSPHPAGPVIELGCGLALPSLVLLGAGCSVLATDYYREALEFARANAERNGLPRLRTRLLDWRHRPADLHGFSTALAADVLYERRNAHALCALLPTLLRPGGTLLLADPGRTYRAEFDALMEDQGWTLHLEAESTEAASDAPGEPVSRVAIVRYRAPAEEPSR